MGNNYLIKINYSEVLKIPIKENNEPLVDLRKLAEISISSYKKRESDSFFKIRKSVAEKLSEAQKYLSNNLRLLIFEGYRPTSLQKEYFEEYLGYLKKLNPDWNEEKLCSETSKFVAPPEIIPPHSTGGAVDLTIIDKNYKELDMGTRINASPANSKNACFTFAENISEKAKKNRQILIEAMTKAGFVNYPFEWWHWSYGDRYWAFVKKQTFAVYSSVEN